MYLKTEIRERRDTMALLDDIDEETLTANSALSGRLRAAKTGGGGLRSLTLDDESDLIAVVEHERIFSRRQDHLQGLTHN